MVMSSGRRCACIAGAPVWPGSHRHAPECTPDPGVAVTASVPVRPPDGRPAKSFSIWYVSADCVICVTTQGGKMTHPDPDRDGPGLVSGAARREPTAAEFRAVQASRSEEHTSELQSRGHI